MQPLYVVFIVVVVAKVKSFFFFANQLDSQSASHVLCFGLINVVRSSLNIMNTNLQIVTENIRKVKIKKIQIQIQIRNIVKIFQQQEFINIKGQLLKVISIHSTFLIQTLVLKFVQLYRDKLFSDDKYNTNSFIYFKVYYCN